MTGVLIAAAKTDKKMWKTFPSILCRNLHAVYIQDSKQQNPAKETEIVVCDIALHGHIPMDNTILIWKQGAPIPKLLSTDRNIIAVVDADSAPQSLEPLSETALPAITCGMSARDTLTLSSYGSENTVITLQRSLSRFDGSFIEPQEMPLAYSGPVDSFTLMASAAVFLLTGNKKRLYDADFESELFK